MRISIAGYVDKVIKISTEVPSDLADNLKFKHEIQAELFPVGSKNANQNPVEIKYSIHQQQFLEIKGDVALAVIK